MSKETFDPITRSIRVAETKARQAITGAENAIVAHGKKKPRTVESFRPVFDELGTCLEEVAALYDNVVAHSHLVPTNIADRSRRNVLEIRKGLTEVSNAMLQIVRLENDFPINGVYNPQGAFDLITDALKKDGYLTEDPQISTMKIDASSIGFIATYKLEQYVFSIVVTVSAGLGSVLGNGADNAVVSVWENRLPPVWDTSYHNTAGQMLPIGTSKRLGKWTRQTDQALVDYVAATIGKDVKLSTPSSYPGARKSPHFDANRYDTSRVRTGRNGSEQFDYESHATILEGAVTGVSIGPQNTLVLQLNPKTITKSTLALYILNIIQGYSKTDLCGQVGFNGGITGGDPEANYEIVYPSALLVGNIVTNILDGKPDAP